MKRLVLLAIFAFVVMMGHAQLSIGDVAPDFKLKSTDNKSVSLKQYSAEKGVILVFTCNHCPYAKLYEDRIIALDKEYKTKGFPVIAINPNNPEEFEEDSFENMIKRAKDKGFTFPYLVDDQGLYAKYGATKTPHIYLLKNDAGKFKVSYIGAIDDSPRDASRVKEKYLAQAIDAELSGKEPKVKETKAIGCSIKAY
ncbi:thioredoxin family protein [Saccharicrinis fermentans]|uniref:Thiol-disulfide oxidoreductase n=1 Tax=Saccharicrinis fermentans DSM 9555 = JCM 21142 TaxID=869213 RepID=W7YIL7_9BACT|nr:thioredoxin family protein [Saccharicrinis fermentans]GAF02384.1 thiol-disulfide oxidoreductase [Saccharicrinis fermentans DSM 9555 = JCM 21142]